MNHAVAQRLTRFAEDTARVERKVDEILALLRPLTTPVAFITTPGGGRITVDPGCVEPRIAPSGQPYGHDHTSRGVVRALHAFGHIAGDADTGKSTTAAAAMGELKKAADSARDAVLGFRDALLGQNDAQTTFRQATLDHADALQQYADVQRRVRSGEITGAAAKRELAAAELAVQRSENGVARARVGIVRANKDAAASVKELTARHNEERDAALKAVQLARTAAQVTPSPSTINARTAAEKALADTLNRQAAELKPLIAETARKGKADTTAGRMARDMNATLREQAAAVPVRLPQITVVDLTGMAKALHAYGHVIEPGDTQEEAIRRVLDIERARRDAAINEEREARAEVRDLADKLDAALVELAATKAGADKLCSEWPGGPARILTGGVVVLPGTLSTLFRERRRWWGRLRR